MADNGSTRLPRYPFTRSTAPADPPVRGESERAESGNDPLSELARLIGQQDPFVDATPSTPRRDLRDILAGRRDSETADRHASDILGRREADWPVAPPLAATPRYDSHFPAADDSVSNFDSVGPYSSSDPSAFGASQEREFPPYDPPSPYETPSEYGQGVPDTPLYGDNGRLLKAEPQLGVPYDAPDGVADGPYQPEEAPARSQKGLFAVIAIFCLAVAGTAGAYAYRVMYNGGTSGPPPLIRADGGPNKVAAAQSGEGAGKQIYDRFGGDRSQNEKLVPREEQPVDVRPSEPRSAFPQQQSSGPPSGVAGGTNPGWPVPPGTTPSGSAGANPANEPRRIRTIPIRSDQLAAAPETQSAVPPPGSQTATPPVAAPAERTETRPAQQRSSGSAPSGGPMSLTPQGSRATATAAVPRAAETTATGGYVVQLAAHKTQDEAAESFRSAQARYPSVLNGRKMLIRKKEIPGKGTFYGAQVGPFASRDGAVQLCESLKSVGGSCIVQRN